MVKKKISFNELMRRAKHSPDAPPEARYYVRLEGASRAHFFADTSEIVPYFENTLGYEVTGKEK